MRDDDDICLNGMRINCQQGTGFSLTELLLVMALVAILAALLLPALKTAKARTKTVACLPKMRQIGIASIAFAGDNNDCLPAGTMPNTNRFLSAFQAVLHEAGTPKLFLCPADSERRAGLSMSSLDRSNTSYFVSYSATTDQPGGILTGDRNIMCDVGSPGYHSRITGANVLNRTNTFGWWRDLHRSRGNLLLADGSVRTTSAGELNADTGTQPEPSFTWFVPNGDWIIDP